MRHSESLVVGKFVCRSGLAFSRRLESAIRPISVIIGPRRFCRTFYRRLVSFFVSSLCRQCRAFGLYSESLVVGSLFRARRDCYSSSPRRSRCIAFEKIARCAGSWMRINIWAKEPGRSVCRCLRSLVVGRFSRSVLWGQVYPPNWSQHVAAAKRVRCAGSRALCNLRDLLSSPESEFEICLERPFVASARIRSNSVIPQTSL